MIGLIEGQARVQPNAIFLSDARSDRTVTFASVRVGAQRWAEALDHAGVPADGRVMIAVDDPIAFSLTFLGVIAAGRCAVPIDPTAPAGEAARYAAAVRPHAIVRDDGTPVANPICVDPATGLPITSAPPAEGGSRPTDGRRTDGRLRLYTSGSTGEPKAVQLSAAQLLHVARAVATHNRLTQADRGYNPLPLFHINAEVVALLASLIAGAELVLDHRFHRHDFWSLVRDRNVTWVNAVPAILSILTREALPARPPALRFIRSASAPLPAAVHAILTETMGEIIVESYGMTEAASQITATPLPGVGVGSGIEVGVGSAPPRGSAGLPVGVELQVRERDGSCAPTGAVGRIWIRGGGVIAGYVGGRAADRFDEQGWLDTGDLGRLDADGYLYLAGRADDVINRGGELVYPREIEEILMGDPRVLDAVVVGRTHHVLGQVPVGYVIPRSPNADGPTLLANLDAACTENLSRFKRPAELILVDDLPRAPTGKIRRAEVRRAKIRGTAAEISGR